MEQGNERKGDSRKIDQSILDKQLAVLPKEVKWCRKCVVSNQRPRIEFDENGVCSACKYAYRKQHEIDWDKREKELVELLDKYRRNDGTFDVIVPGSGGKDGSYVAHQLKHKYGMHPLTVTWSPFEYTEIGWQNFRNFTKAGFNNLLATPNGRLHRKLSRAAFETLGDAWQPFTYGQLCYAFHIALKFGVNLVFYGENGEAEYGGATRNNSERGMPIEDWAELYLKGVTVDDLVDYALKNGYLTKDDYDESDLMFYRFPPLEEMKKGKIQMHWYAYYHKWVPQENYYYATEHTGFQANPEGRSEGTYSKYASLDDKTDGFHFYLGYVKFGIGRCVSDAAHEIRDGHLTREEGVSLVRRYDGEFPKKHFKEFLEYLEITEDDFWKVIDKFANKKIMENIDGQWKLKKEYQIK